MCNCNGKCGDKCKCKQKERYVIGQDFNTKEWFVYDNETDKNVCYGQTEDEVKRFVERKMEKIENANTKN